VKQASDWVPPDSAELITIRMSVAIPSMGVLACRHDTQEPRGWLSLSPDHPQAQPPCGGLPGPVARLQPNSH
jgi:hypothetical protein